LEEEKRGIEGSKISLIEFLFSSNIGRIERREKRDLKYFKYITKKYFYLCFEI